METSQGARGCPPGGEIDVWCLPLVGPTTRTDELDGALTLDERHQLGRIVSEARRERTRMAWGARRLILARLLECEPRAIVIRRPRLGAPTVDARGRTLHISLSHSADRMLFAMSQTRRLGVDIERADPEADTVRLARRFFRSDEADALASLPSDRRCLAFFRAWTRKEALVKAVGGGVPSSLRSLPSGLSAPHESVVVGDVTWAFYDLAAPEPYVAALVADAADAAVRVHDAI